MLSWVSCSLLSLALWAPSISATREDRRLHCHYGGSHSCCSSQTPPWILEGEHPDAMAQWSGDPCVLSALTLGLRISVSTPHNFPSENSVRNVVLHSLLPGVPRKSAADRCGWCTGRMAQDVGPGAESVPLGYRTRLRGWHRKVVEDKTVSEDPRSEKWASGPRILVEAWIPVMSQVRGPLIYTSQFVIFATRRELGKTVIIVPSV